MKKKNLIALIGIFCVSGCITLFSFIWEKLPKCDEFVCSNWWEPPFFIFVFLFVSYLFHLFILEYFKLGDE